MNIELQPQINIGMIGHVSDGKSTLVKALTGQTTQRFSKEKQNNLTIKLGYANCKIIKCVNCPEPDCYGSTSSNVMDYFCKKCGNPAILVNHVSFVDCPGHHSFMQTMLSGTSVMDYTILVESLGNKQIPAPQTIKHLNSIESTQIENCMIVLNKIDLVNRDKCKEAITDMKSFIKDYKAKSNPIIPISASLNINIDIVCSILAKLQPKKIYQEHMFRMNIIRSFNVNKPGVNIENLQGGVIGGSIQSGSIELSNDCLFYTSDAADDHLAV
jgi:translation initiation factor 2 subunit 3